ncbi:16S rRNA (cytosine(967)-C(5))-methyl transferase /SSU rRNA m5C967 [Salmonella enterica subsp. arizonae]|uniref:16S rRNA (Cytosine(967)-C(5))-methyl transferase /SSU rRNA m5C967 n=1 Tax=Salmonella enterica subsp. arizonae TaxID=59203 RepID=A0A379T578_SALER|nr:16S rRNA (cytosine(967)-C(5))-methyl transferase /SSU rRNA m5C967 [Salmonella enterica subsp. arizonae]
MDVIPPNGATSSSLTVSCWMRPVPQPASFAVIQISKWLRRDRDIAELAKLQAEILDAVWPRLKPGGTLVYATCSVLPEENSAQINAFLQRTPDAALSETGTPDQPGQQNLPGAEEGRRVLLR